MPVAASNRSALIRLACCAATLLVGSVQADWRDNAGYAALQAELGSAMPDGTGIPVMLSEATVSATEFIYLQIGRAHV